LNNNVLEYCCVYLSLERKRIFRACVDNKVDRKDVYAAVSKAKALNIVVGRPYWGMEELICFRFKRLSMAFRNQKDLDGMFV
jgi:hypothetical protein